ncbi:MAG: hypothetical protein CVU97_00345 [Firmicutes bacterium HGW-Firmicutes-21]|nr:MAG: hypothetical protein CVU97_00345 [Firmicutes bacterium HGW-Firmicutes-21]
MTDNRYSAVVMAGGFGSRLAPMTNSIPKPMLPLNNRSVFERILDLLAENGFTSAAVTTMYLPEQIERVRHERINLAFYRESSPLGSAGAVRALYDILSETVLIISGDAVCDFKLKKYIARHISNKRTATLLLTRTKCPQEFGTVLTENGTDRIVRFLEKPSWADTVSNLINTGIYILDKSVIGMIPEGVFFDFGRDLFPLLLQKGVPLYGEEADGFWCDIGSFGDYYNCNMRSSGGDNVIAESCVINGFAKIRESILFDRVSVGYSEIKCSILCEGVSVGDGCVIPEGCVIGAGSVICDRVVLSEGVKISDNIKIARGARIMGNVFFSTTARHLFCEDGIKGKYGSEIDGELCFKLGQGLSSLGKPARIGVMNDGSEIGELLSDIIKVGVRSGGGYMLELEDGFLPLAAFAPQEYDLDCCVFVSINGFEIGDNTVNILLFERNGLLFSHEKQRKTENAMREKLPVPENIPAPDILSREQRIKFRYCLYLQAVTGPLGSVDIKAVGSNEQANFFFSNARELGANTELIHEGSSSAARDSFVFNNKGVYALTKSGRELYFWQMFILAAQSGSRKELFLPQSTPEAVESYLKEKGIAIHFYNDGESEQRKKAFGTHFYNDSVLLALLVCRYLRENNVSLDKAYQTLPQLFVRSVDIDADEEDKADIIGSLAEECGDCSRGVRLHTEKGSVAVFPRTDGGFRVFAEAVNAEFAEELCDLAERKIKSTKE